MTAVPEIHFRCDRCGEEINVPMPAAGPGLTRFSPPPSWLELWVDANQRARHLCPPCKQQYIAFMETHVSTT